MISNTGLKKIFILALGITLSLFLVAIVFAPQALAASDLELPNPLTSNSIPDLISKLFSQLIKYVVPPVGTVMIVIGAFQILTAGGNAEKFEKGKKTVFYTVIGLIVVILGGVIAQLVAEILGAPQEVIDEFAGLGT
jgi:hypothetical protein